MQPVHYPHVRDTGKHTYTLIFCFISVFAAVTANLWLFLKCQNENNFCSRFFHNLHETSVLEVSRFQFKLHWRYAKLYFYISNVWNKIWIYIYVIGPLNVASCWTFLSSALAVLEWWGPLSGSNQPRQIPLPLSLWLGMLLPFSAGHPWGITLPLPFASKRNEERSERCSTFLSERALAFQERAMYVTWQSPSGLSCCGKPGKRGLVSILHPLVRRRRTCAICLPKHRRAQSWWCIQPWLLAGLMENHGCGWCFWAGLHSSQPQTKLLSFDCCCGSCSLSSTGFQQPPGPQVRSNSDGCSAHFAAHDVSCETCPLQGRYMFHPASWTTLQDLEWMWASGLLERKI